MDVSILYALHRYRRWRSAEYEEEVRQARSIALEEMAAEAERKGGNAVVGVDIDYEVIRQGMLMVSASGTSVRVR